MAGRMEKLVEAGGKPEEALYLFLSECDYYTEKEAQKFKQTAASYRNLPEHAYEKAWRIISFPENNMEERCNAMKS